MLYQDSDDPKVQKNLKDLLEAAVSYPLSNLRVNVCSQMFDPMYDMLGVAEGDGMYLAPDKRIVIWGPNA